MNLTQMSALVKKSFKYIVLFVAGYYLLIYVLIPGSATVIKKIFTHNDPATPTYGLLDQLSFVEKSIGASKPTYELGTKTGRLPSGLPEKMKVYQFKPMQYSYLAGKNAIEEASTLGFAEADLISDLKGSEYVWRNNLTQSMLTIELTSRHINLFTNLTGKGLGFVPGSINNESAIKKAIDIMTSINRMDDTYIDGTQVVKLGAYNGSKIYETTDLTEAQIAIVDFYRKIDKFPILGPDPAKGLMRLYVRQKTNVSKSPMNNPFIEASYWEINPTSNATYPIITVADAWNAIKNGRGIIVNTTPKGSNAFDTTSPVEIGKISIDTIYLAYYETPKYQKYLQPIYVFSGTYNNKVGSGGGTIVIYFPAVSGQFVKQNTPTPTSTK